MSTDSHHRWMSDFLEEMGLPARAEFQGYVLFNLEQNTFCLLYTSDAADE